LAWWASIRETRVPRKTSNFSLLACLGLGGSYFFLKGIQLDQHPFHHSLYFCSMTIRVSYITFNPIQLIQWSHFWRQLSRVWSVTIDEFWIDRIY
jgi:hypothetical protein